MPILSLFSSRADNILYYRIKTNSLTLRKEEFIWHKRIDPYCRFCNSFSETLNHLIFECHCIQQEVINIRRIFSEAKFLPDINVLLLSSLPANTERHLYKSIFDFLRQQYLRQVHIDGSKTYSWPIIPCRLKIVVKPKGDRSGLQKAWHSKKNIHLHSVKKKGDRGLC